MLNAAPPPELDPRRTPGAARAGGVGTGSDRTSLGALLLSLCLHGMAFGLCTFVWSWGGGQLGASGMDEQDADAPFSPSLAFEPQPSESVRITMARPQAFQPAVSPTLRAKTDLSEIQVPDWQMQEVEPVEAPEVSPEPEEPKKPVSAAASTTNGKLKGVERKQAGSGAGSDRGRGTSDTGAPQIVSSRAPEYPWDARRQGIQGVATVRVKVSTNGSVLACSIHRSAGHRSLDESALRAVRRWRFTPAQSDGVEVLVTVTFRLS